MIAMQYSFTLPADYDMAIIQRRIAEKGHLLDDFPGLAFKAYLYASRDEGSRENLYAPFYLWHDVEGMNAFLGGTGFAALTQSFGWPSVLTWPVWHVGREADISMASHSTREIIALPAHSAIDTWRRAETSIASEDMAHGALAAISAFEPATWTRLRFRLWPAPPAGTGQENLQTYRVGYIAQSDRTRSIPA